MYRLFVLWLGIVFSASLMCPMSIPELLVALGATSKTLSVVSEEKEKVFWQAPFEELSTALSQLETEKTAVYNLVSSYQLVVKMLDTLSLKLEYMSHWVAFERLQKDLAAVLKAHGVSLETVVTSCVKSRTAASVSDGECGASAYVSVRSCAGRAGSSGLFRSVIDVFAEELCLESNVFELDLFKEEYQWIHDQLAGISTKFLSVAQFQQLYEVLDLVNHDGLVEFLETGHCEEGQHEELRDKNQLACTAIKEIALIADGQVTHDQQEALYQLQSFARFINTKITAALDCSLEHTEEDVDADWLSDDSDSVALSTESDADRKKRRKDALARGKPGEPARRPMRIAPKYKRSLSV